MVTAEPLHGSRAASKQFCGGGDVSPVLTDQGVQEVLGLDVSGTTPPRTAEGEEDNAPRLGGVALDRRFIIARVSTDSPATNPFTFNISFRLAF